MLCYGTHLLNPTTLNSNIASMNFFFFYFTQEQWCYSTWWIQTECMYKRLDHSNHISWQSGTHFTHFHQKCIHVYIYLSFTGWFNCHTWSWAREQKTIQHSFRHISLIPGLNHSRVQIRSTKTEASAWEIYPTHHSDCQLTPSLLWWRVWWIGPVQISIRPL